MDANHYILKSQQVSSNPVKRFTNAKLNVVVSSNCKSYRFFLSRFSVEIYHKTFSILLSDEVRRRIN